MPVDVTPEYWGSVLAAGRAQGLGEDKIKKLRSAQLLRSLAARTDFTKAAIEVANNILALRLYLKEHQRDYAQQGKLREAERDRVEEEVGAYVRSCSANIDTLQQMLGAERLPAAEDLRAHRQGMVLILSERLKLLTTAFDRLRSLRFQQLQQAEAARLRRLPPPQQPSPGRAAGGRTTGELHSMLLQAQRGAPPPPQQPPKQPPQLFQPPPGPGGAAGAPQAWQQPQQRQQRQLMDPENQALQLELMSMGEQVTHAERTVREIAALNQMFSTTILHQSEQIEQLYEQAVDASQNIGSANVQLRKTIKVNSSSRKYLLVFLLVASLGLLFLDWWSS